MKAATGTWELLPCFFLNLKHFEPDSSVCLGECVTGQWSVVSGHQGPHLVVIDFSNTIKVKVCGKDLSVYIKKISSFCQL